MFKIATERKLSTWLATAAFACFVTAVLAGATGTILTTAWLLNEQLHPWLHRIGLTLLVIALPLLILGGHFLDLRERKNLA